MMRTVAILTCNDLAIAARNKTIFLILFVPLFVFAVSLLVDGQEPAIEQIRIGLVAEQHYPPAMLASLQSADRLVAVTWLPDEAEGRQWLKDRHGDGMLVPSGNAAGTSTLVVLMSASLQTVAIVETIAGLQRVVEGRDGDWIADIHPLLDGGLASQMLPTWILLLVLLVGFITLPAQVAEEKEKKLILGLLQTPIREVEWLFAKILSGMILVMMAALLLHLLLAFGSDSPIGWSYLAFLLAGGFCFSAFGVLVGFLCQTQATARTLGVLFYLPHLLPSALADFSRPLHSVAPFIPSYQFYQPIRSILQEGSTVGDFPQALLALLALGVLAGGLSYGLMKKRWLM